MNAVPQVITKDDGEDGENQEDIDRIIDEIDWEQERKEFVDTVSSELQDQFEEFIQITLALRGLTWQEYDPISDVARSWVGEYAFELAKQINDTTKERLREKMIANMEEGSGVDYLARSIQDVIEEATEYRAFMIARTETTYATNMGTLAAYKGAGMTTKTWLTGEDERVCEICGGVNGETVGIDEEFSIGKVAPPAHPNCRCTIITDVSQ